MTNARTIHVNGVDLCVDTLGDPTDPALLLISGMAGSMDSWEDEFCDQLVAGRRFVIRYDHRDTGQSVTYPPGEPGYTIADLEADAVAILDELGVARAHLVGFSMGGALAQRVAVHRPDRVASLTLISTSPGPGGPGTAELPPSDESVLAFFATERPAPDWSDRVAVIEHYLANQRPLGPPGHVDERQLAAAVGRVFDRSRDLAAATNHQSLASTEEFRQRLGEITAPTLVVHGRDDRLLPLGHAEALAAEIPGAELLALDGVGHQSPPASTWPLLVPAILRLTSGGWPAQADRLAATALRLGEPTAWFERLYGAASSGEVPMPWDRGAPHPVLAEWIQGTGPHAVGRRAVVVGCGLGADAEYLAGLGFDTVAFDISPSAVRIARERNPDSSVEYVVADVLDPPQHWVQAFDLIVEIYTVQALPGSLRAAVTRAVGRLLAPGGTLFVVQAVRADAEQASDAEGPPWPLSRDEIAGFATDGIVPVELAQRADPRLPSNQVWRALFTRPG